MNLRRFYDIVCLRLRSVFRKKNLESDLDRELSFHLFEQVRENLASGMSPEQARFAAMRSLGGADQIKERCRDMRRTNYIETMWNDLRYAIRLLGRNPGFTVVIVLTMALSIGANSAIFSVIEGVLLRPLPFASPDRIVRIYMGSATYPIFPLNPNDFNDLRADNKMFDSIAAIMRSDMQLSGSGDPVMLRGFRISRGYFHVIGLSPAQGREFTKDDELPARGNVAIISDRLWRTRFASSRDIVGRSITLNAEPFTVVGVMPPGVQHPGNDYHEVADGETVDVWSPFSFNFNPNNRGSHFIEGFGRLKPGVSSEQANADLNSIFAEIANKYPSSKGWHVFTMPLYQEMVGRTQRMLLVLLAAVGLLLLIACVNAANLLLARANARQREIAIRSALGAGRARIVRQLLTESLVIAIAGAALGTLLAMGGVRVLRATLPPGFPRASEIRLDLSVFGFTLIVAVLTGLLFGLVPALTASRTDLQQSLREGGRSATGSNRQLRLRNFLVIGETGLACILLIGAGLLLHSFVNLLRADPGFRPEKVLTATIALPFQQYKTREQGEQFFSQLITDLASLHGVKLVGEATDLPWTGYDENTGFAVEGRSAEFNDNTSARYHVASPDYFRALGVPLVRGRFVTVRDDSNAPPVIIINETMAKTYWPNEDAVGKRISFTDNPTEKDWFRIVGVVGDIKDQPDSKAAKSAFWWPETQQLYGGFGGARSIVVRSDSDRASMVDQLRATVRRIDPSLALDDVRFVDQIVDAAVATRRFTLFLVGLFAALALVLATIGMYGVISYSVSQRIHEFGIRMALGAKPRDVMRLIVGQGLRLFAVGAAIGLVCAALLSKLLGSLLYGVSSTDPLSFAAVATIALITTTLACYIPARTAADADPMLSIRSD